MSANRSPRQVRSAILSGSTADYAAWALLVSCAACDRADKPVPIERLGNGTVADGMRRLRCSSCGRRATEIVITNGLAGWRGRTVRLLGDGAYG